MTRSVVAVLLAPAFAAMPMIILELAYDNWKPSLCSAVGYMEYTYAFTLIPAAVVVYGLRKLWLKRIWQYALAGLLVAMVCTSAFSVLIPGGRFPMRIGEFEIVLFSSGVLSGILVWVICESEIFRRAR